MRNSGLRAFALGIAGGAVLLFSACAAKTNNEITVTAKTAVAGTVTKTVEFSGVFAPEQTVNVFSELPGHAVRVTAAVGDTVKAGQLLVQIDTRQLAAQLQEAEAAVQAVEEQAAQAQLGVKTAKANLDLAQVSYDRTASLFKTQAVSKNELDDVQNKLDLARSAYQNAQQQYELLTGSGLAQAKARVDLINVQLSNSIIDSPISGVVTNRNVNPGELVGVSMPVMTIADTSTLQLQGTVSQDVIPLLTLGQTVTVAVDGMNGLSFDGRVSQIGPVAAPTGQYFPVVASVRNNGKLLAGMTAVASFSITSPQSVIVPSAAVQRDGEDFYVYVVNGGKVTRTRVTIGLQGASRTVVASGLSAGEAVATTNVGLLADGLPVTVAN